MIENSTDKWAARAHFTGTGRPEQGL